MSRLSELLQKAAVIRNEVAANENSAERVGTLFVDIITELGNAIASDSLTVVVTSSGASIHFLSTDDEGQENVIRVPLPVVSDNNCGLITPAQIEALREAMRQMVSSSASTINEAIEALRKAVAAAATSANVYTKQQVDDALAAKADSSTVYTKQQVDGKLGTKANDSEVYKKSETYSKLETEGLVSRKADSSNVYTKQEMDEDLQTLTKKIEDVDDAKPDKETVYTKQEMDEALAAKADSSSIYTKQQVDDALTAKADSNSVYTKQQVDEKLGEKVSTNAMNSALQVKADKKDMDILRLRTLVERQKSYTLGTTDTINFMPAPDGLTLAAMSGGYMSTGITLGKGDTIRFLSANGSIYRLLEVDNVIAAGSSIEQVASAVNGVSEWVATANCKVLIFDGGVNPMLGQNYTIIGSMTRLLQQVDEALSGKADGSSVYTKQEVDEMLEDKADAGVSGVFNITCEVPLQGGYYTLLDTENENRSALHVALQSGKAAKGLIISFEIAADTWKTYQFTGYDTTPANWLNTDKWKDFGSLAAGSETYIVIDSLCGRRSSGSPYDLASAVEALATHEANSGVQYRKEGLIIAYKISDSEMETKQFQGAISDFLDLNFWDDFGGSSKTETADDPEEDGKDAFSTGGAYKHVPIQIGLDNSQEGLVKLSLLNADHEAIGDEVMFQVGTGGGGSVATLNFDFVNANRYCAAGSSYILSIDVDTEDEVDTIIIANKTTGAVLKTIRDPKPSAGLYRVDLSEYFTAASVQKFSITVESGSLSLTKSLTVTAVDVTIQSVQTLNYTADTVLRVGGGQTSIGLFKFPNNVSSIRATVEVYHEGTWRTLLERTVTSTATQSLLLNPRDIFGDGTYVPGHSVMPLRIHGVDINSSVVGNYLYTGIFVIGSEDSPLVLMNWLSPAESWEIKLLETADINVAVYDPSNVIGQANFYMLDSGTGRETLIRSLAADRYKAYTLSQRIENVEFDGSVTLTVRGESGTFHTPLDAQMTVNGSLLEITQAAGVTLDINFKGRSNSDTDKSIKASFVNAAGQDETYELSLQGCNYSSNGFVKDTYGTPAYDGDNGPGRMSLRIAEDIFGVLNYPHFANDSMETNGACLQITFMVKNVLDASQVIFKQYDGTVGFYVNGRSIIFTTVGATPEQAASQDSTSIRANYTQGEVITMAIVMEPVDTAPKGGIGLVKLYINGEEVGACYYNRGRSACYSEALMEFFGNYADLHIYDIKTWRTFPYDYEQVFKDYILNLSDVGNMISEYTMNAGIMSSQAITAEPTIPSDLVHVETGTALRPQAEALYNSGIAYVVITANAEAIAEGYTYADERDGGNFPSWLDSRRGDKKSSIFVDVYAYFPDRPWQNFKAVKVPMTNQGTTSSQRPIKNVKMKFKKCKSMELLHKRSDFTSEQDLAYYDECAVNIAKHKVQILNESMPTNIITIKVDYSESGGAHNGASTELFNLLQRALGEKYMTPAQVAYTGKYTLNTSIDSVPCALFRTDTTEERNAYFHAKGNWNQDKGDAEIYGFENCPGYNKGCLNYGDFIEVVATTAADGVDQAQLLKTRADAYVAEHFAEMDASMPYMFSEFCGPNVRFFRDDNTGRFIEVDAVDNFVDSELTLETMNHNISIWEKNVTYRTSDGKFAHYQSAGWEDTTGSFYFNSVTGQWTVTGDALNPVECYELLTYVGKAWFRGVATPADMIMEDDHWTKYFESRYPDNDDLNALYESSQKIPYNLYHWMEFCNRADYETGNPQLFKTDLYKYANPYSLMCYHVYTDYILAVDQRSKNMMVSIYRYKDGRDKVSLQHLYDGDTIWGSDNDCGQTVPIDIDPQGDGKTYYAGFGGVIWNNLAIVDSVVVNENGDTITLSQVLNAMRTAQTSEGWAPFSQAGCERLWLTKRLQKWPKLVSSFDQERKYIHTMAYDNTYLYAMHGLGLHSLPEIFAKRFKIRDGFYGGPSYISDQAAFRGVPNSSTLGIRIGVTAASDGYFTIGVEGADDSRRMTPVYLREGESHTFVTGLKQVDNVGGSAIIVIGASNIAELDISSSTWISMSFDNFTRLKKLIIGGQDFQGNSRVSATSNVDLGNKPYLQKVDIRNTGTTEINASGCPRLTELLADGSSLQTFHLAETSRIETLTLPDSVTSLEFYSLPNLQYKGLNAAEGLIINSWQNISRIRLENNANLDIVQLLTDVFASQAGSVALSRLRIVQDTVAGRANELMDLVEAGVKGITSSGSNQEKPAYLATYKLTVIRDNEDLDTITGNIEGIVLEVSIEAFINLIEEDINCEGYGGASEVPEITMENIDELALSYYNGEDYDDYIDTLIEAEKPVNTIAQE